MTIPIDTLRSASSRFVDLRWVCRIKVFLPAADAFPVLRVTAEKITELPESVRAKQVPTPRRFDA
jgi:hypothetical protein